MNATSAVSEWRYRQLRRELQEERRTWLVTGVAGFIGSNLLEALLALGQDVVGLDNFSTGYQHNIDDVLAQPASANGQFRLVTGDIRDRDACAEAARGVDYVLHQAALGSVPRSIDDPAESTSVNVDGFINVMLAARDARVRRMVYASSCAVYGDAPSVPLAEDQSAAVLSPYAASKLADEIYASVFQRLYALQLIGLRYFNVFGPRQDPNGAYAAVIPRWVAALLDGNTPEILGDGETSRDFCYVENVVAANLLAATAPPVIGFSPVYNVASGTETTLNDLYRMIRLGLVGHDPLLASVQATYGPFRDGDIRRSAADITRIRRELQYEPEHTTAQGLGQCLDWYVSSWSRRALPAAAPA